MPQCQVDQIIGKIYVNHLLMVNCSVYKNAEQEQKEIIDKSPSR